MNAPPSSGRCATRVVELELAIVTDARERGYVDPSQWDRMFTARLALRAALDAEAKIAQEASA